MEKCKPLLLGGGWEETAWGGEEPTAEWLGDDDSPLLVWLLRADAHTGVASPAALRAAGVTALTPDPPGGVIERRRSGGGGGGGGGEGGGRGVAGAYTRSLYSSTSAVSDT